MGTKASTAVGEVYGRLTVLEDLPFEPGRRRLVSVECECGTRTTTRLDALRAGVTVSCGCKKKEHNLKHGHRRTGTQDSTYVSWYSMMGRCTNPNNPAYIHYGGRGITVSECWLSFERFLEDMGERPAGTSIERKNNEEGYSASNCVWLPSSEQAGNTRRSIRFEFDGKIYGIKEFAAVTGLPASTIRSRHKDGWSTERIASTPMKGKS